ncbi:hypothetical protein OEG84_11390 [Hoeflea sp. G2-23]|uniref:Uncharacterized protein n=1 Tax=Hoeflea algicola TaxID=2983763 RepID=A0ABT3ZAL6_9HYPH|nr:hypothetical protein [Hoeflea algicola]MCY0148296.1 hypothetical protein [Hoeflea algicola]
MFSLAVMVQWIADARIASATVAGIFAATHPTPRPVMVVLADPPLAIADSAIRVTFTLDFADLSQHHGRLLLFLLTFRQARQDSERHARLNACIEKLFPIGQCVTPPCAHVRLAKFFKLPNPSPLVSDAAFKLQLIGWHHELLRFSVNFYAIRQYVITGPGVQPIKMMGLIDNPARRIWRASVHLDERLIRSNGRAMFGLAVPINPRPPLAPIVWLP